MFHMLVQPMDRLPKPNEAIMMAANHRPNAIWPMRRLTTSRPNIP